MPPRGRLDSQVLWAPCVTSRWGGPPPAGAVDTAAGRTSTGDPEVGHPLTRVLGQRSPGRAVTGSRSHFPRHHLVGAVSRSPVHLGHPYVTAETFPPGAGNPWAGSSGAPPGCSGLLVYGPPQNQPRGCHARSAPVRSGEPRVDGELAELAGFAGPAGFRRSIPPGDLCDLVPRRCDRGHSVHDRSARARTRRPRNSPDPLGTRTPPTTAATSSVEVEQILVEACVVPGAGGVTRPNRESRQRTARPRRDADGGRRRAPAAGDVEPLPVVTRSPSPVGWLSDI
jgi:hypothetical protein